VEPPPVPIPPRGTCGTWGTGPGAVGVPLGVGPGPGPGLALALGTGLGLGLGLGAWPMMWVVMAVRQVTTLPPGLPVPLH
jgi:hypothetical protein